MLFKRFDSFDKVQSVKVNITSYNPNQREIIGVKNTLNIIKQLNGLVQNVIARANLRQLGVSCLAKLEHQCSDDSSWLLHLDIFYQNAAPG